MKIEQAIMQASAALNQHIEDAAEAAQEQIRQDAARARDWLTVKVGWMIRSNAQLRRFRNARKAKQ